MNPTDARFSREHEWVRIERDNIAVIGITQYASETLGDVVYLDLPDAGTKVGQFKKLGEVESVKAVSDLLSPISGRVIERNAAVVERPELVNASPQEDGWLLKIAASDLSELSGLLTAEEYEAFLAAERR